MTVIGYDNKTEKELMPLIILGDEPIRILIKPEYFHIEFCFPAFRQTKEDEDFLMIFDISQEIPEFKEGNIEIQEYQLNGMMEIKPYRSLKVKGIFHDHNGNRYRYKISDLTIVTRIKV